jgi:multidrug resistance efflux pump
MIKRWMPLYIGLLTLIALTGCSEAKPALLHAEMGAKKQANSTHNYTGKITGINEVAIVPKVSGRIEKVFKDVGDPVNEGDVLLSLEKTDLQAQLESANSDLSLARAKYNEMVKGSREEDIRAAQAAYQAALAKYQDVKNGSRPEQIHALKSALDTAKSGYENAKTTLDRTKALYDQGAAPKQTYDAAVVAYKQAESQYVAAGDNLKLATEGPTTETLKSMQATVEQAKATLDKIKNGATPEEIQQAESLVQKATSMVNLNQYALANGSLKSPIKGYIASRVINAGELASIGVPVMTVVNTDQVYLSIEVPESDLKDIKLSQNVTVQVDALGKKVKGKISQISPKAIQATDKFLVKILVDNPDHSLRSGMTGVVNIEGQGTTPK